LLDPLLFQTFIRYFLGSNVRATIRLGRIEFLISEILSTPGSHPLAGYDSLDQLNDYWAKVMLEPSHRTIPLDFCSPTAFSIKNKAYRHMVVLPDPVLVFGQLATYWDNLTGSETAETVRTYAAEAVVVARHRIETHMYQFRKSKQIGFTGRVRFKLLDKDDDTMIRHLNRLADLAFYTGLGSKTAMGMGQVRRFKRDEG
jgi:CRISPR-associated endoribonuclease Cas6